MACAISSTRVSNSDSYSQSLGGSDKVYCSATVGLSHTLPGKPAYWNVIEYKTKSLVVMPRGSEATLCTISAMVSG